MANNKPITLAVLSSKIDTITEVVRRVDSTLNGEGDEPGLKGRLRILEDHEENKKWYFRSIWAALAASAVGQFIARNYLG